MIFEEAMLIRAQLLLSQTLIVLGILLFASCTSQYSQIDLSSPESTMNNYCNAKGIDEFKQLFYDKAELGESFNNQIWTACDVIEVHRTDEAGQRYGDLVVDANDVEVIIEAKMIDPAKGDPKTKFSFLLRKFENNWKIVALSHMPDSNYPAYD